MLRSSMSPWWEGRTCIFSLFLPLSITCCGHGVFLYCQYIGNWGNWSWFLQQWYTKLWDISFVWGSMYVTKGLIILLQLLFFAYLVGFFVNFEICCGLPHYTVLHCVTLVCSWCDSEVTLKANITLLDTQKPALSWERQGPIMYI